MAPDPKTLYNLHIFRINTWQNNKEKEVRILHGVKKFAYTNLL